jgi:hypothetical protein
MDIVPVLTRGSVRVFNNKLGREVDASDEAIIYVGGEDAGEIRIEAEGAQRIASLILAAPDLYAALLHARDEIHHPGAARSIGLDIDEIVNAALAKARP